MSPTPQSGVTRRNLLKVAGGAVAAGAVMGTSGCGLLGGSKASQQSNGQVEKAKIRVGVLPLNEIAPFYFGVKSGLFKQAGLDVDIVIASDGGAALNGTIGGDYDICHSSYVPFFQAQAKDVADLKIVTDCASLAPHTTAIMTAPHSSVRTPADLAGKRIAISAPGTVSDLMVRATMRAHGVDFSKVQWAPVPFINMPNALQQGQVDAALLVEPFITLAARKVGALPIVDVDSGPMEDFPTSGFGATAKFVRENPKTVAAFQGVMDRAVVEAQDRTKLEPLIVEYAKVDKETASIISFFNFHSRADAPRLERVPRLMREFAFIDKDINVENMIAKPQA